MLQTDGVDRRVNMIGLEHDLEQRNSDLEFPEKLRQLLCVSVGICLEVGISYFRNYEEDKFI